MRKLYLVTVIIVLTLVDAAKINYRNRSGSSSRIHSDIFGARAAPNPGTFGQIKRDTSLSYSATNIDSKEGTRVKTITVIKNHNGKNSAKLAINPELHKNEEWANAFRDNFDSYGHIPDVPDIDDLFDFEKKHTNTNNKNNDDNKKHVPKSKAKPKEVEKSAASTSTTTAAPKPVEEDGAGDEEDEVDVEPTTIKVETTTEAVRKITGDAELIPALKKKKKNHTNARSQSLALDKAHTREPLAANYNKTSSEENTNNYFEKYIQEIPKGYDYPKPCPHGGKSVVSITNPSSGRTYDVTLDQDSPGVPYIAPSITKKTQLSGSQNVTQNFASTYARPTFSINSILPPLQSNQNNQNNQNTQQQPVYPPIVNNVGGGGGYSPTSQRPYIAPNIRNNNFNVNGGSSTLGPLYRNDITTYRGNSFLLGANRANAARTRGLKF